MGFEKGEEAQGPTNCGILPSQMGERGVSLENTKNMWNIEKKENTKQMT